MVVGWRLGFDLPSLGLGISAVLAIDLATDQVVRALLQDVRRLGGVARDVEDFILPKPAIPVPITMACALLTGTKIELRYPQLRERDGHSDASFMAAIWALLAAKIVERRRPDTTQFALFNAVYVGAGQPL